jgi:hypothetical protein
VEYADTKRRISARALKSDLKNIKNIKNRPDKDKKIYNHQTMPGLEKLIKGSRTKRPEIKIRPLKGRLAMDKLFLLKKKKTRARTKKTRPLKMKKVFSSFQSSRAGTQKGMASEKIRPAAA